MSNRTRNQQVIRRFLITVTHTTTIYQSSASEHKIYQSSASIWNPILERMEKKLASWKRLYLSKGADSPCWKVHCQASRPIIFPFLLFLKLWQWDWNIFREIFCGVLQLSVSNTLWWLGKKFAYLVSWVGWEFEIWCHLIRLYWENGFGDMDMKLLIYGGGL